MKLKKISTCFLILLFFVPPILAQQVNADVKLILERLPLEKQKKLATLEQDIETYLNDYTWLEESEVEIPIQIQIVLQDVSASFEDRYSGTFLISNTTDLQYYDKYWKFPYQAGDRLVHQEGVFDPFTGFIDFYVYLILGGELDKYSLLGGTKSYEKAKQVLDQARFDTQFMLGWDERTKLLQSILDESNIPFREAKYLLSVSIAYGADEDTTAEKYGLQGIEILTEFFKSYPDHKEAKDFLKAHHIELAETFKNSPSILEKLIALDPERESVYRRYLGKK